MKTFVRFLGFIVFVILFHGYSSAQQSDTLVLQPGPETGKDADIRNDRPDWPNGTSYDFIANAWTAQGNFFIQRSLIYFDLTSIPLNAVVLNATLKLSTNQNTAHYQMDSGPNSSYFLRVLGEWDENQVTWNSQPPVSMTDAVIVPQSTSNTETYYLEVTSHVQDMVSNPETNFGWLFRQQIEERYRCIVFASSNNPMPSWRPKLTVIYSTCKVPPVSFTYSVVDRSVTFHQSTPGATACTWEFGDGTSSNDTNPVHTYSYFGNYKVSLTASNSCGSATYFETIHVPCTEPSASFSYNVSNLGVQFYDTSSSPYILSRYWDFGDSTSSTLHNSDHQYYGGLYVYNVCFTATDSCGSATVCDSVFVEPPMKPHFTSVSNSSDELEVDFTGVAAGAVSLDWSFGDGEHSNLRNPSHTYAAYGDYKVCLTATNPQGMNSSCDSLRLISKLSEGQNGVSIFPNPTSDVLNIKFNSDQVSVHTVLTNIAGSDVFHSELSSIKGGELLNIDLSAYTAGVYFLKIETDKISTLEKVVRK